MSLNSKQMERYSRHIILEQVGAKGQEKILNSRVLIIGAGGLGSPAAMYLTAAGVGTLGLVDDDNVDRTNLQRQILHSTPDVGKPKLTSAKETLTKLNPDVNVVLHKTRATASNIRDLIRNYDFIIDGTDNFSAKFLINDACVFETKPFSHAGILRFDGQTLTILPGKTACYRCVFVEPPPEGAVPSCSQAGVLGVLAGVMGTLQATEALKFILDKGDLYTNRMCVYNGLTGNFRTVKTNPNPDCPVCGTNPSVTELVDTPAATPACDLSKGCCNT